MKRNTPSLRVNFVLVLALTITMVGCRNNQHSGSAVPIEIAWSTDLINTGQLVAVLKHTEITDNFTVQPAFSGIGSNEVIQNFLTTGKADLVILSDQETVKLLAADTSWTLLARVAWEPSRSSQVPDSAGKEPQMALLLGRHTFITRSPAGVVNLLAALMDASLYCARHEEQTRQWYLKENFSDIGPEVLRNSARIDPNLRAMMKGQISINLPERLLTRLQETVDLCVQNGKIKQPYKINLRADLSYLRKAEEKWWKITDNELE